MSPPPSRRSPPSVSFHLHTAWSPLHRKPFEQTSPGKNVQLAWSSGLQKGVLLRSNSRLRSASKSSNLPPVVHFGITCTSTNSPWQDSCNIRSLHWTHGRYSWAKETTCRTAWIDECRNYTSRVQATRSSLTDDRDIQPKKKICQ